MQLKLNNLYTFNECNGLRRGTKGFVSNSLEELQSIISNGNIDDLKEIVFIFNGTTSPFCVGFDDDGRKETYFYFYKVS